MTYGGNGPFKETDCTSLTLPEESHPFTPQPVIIFNVLSLITECDSGNTENQTPMYLLHENLGQIKSTYFIVRKTNQCGPRPHVLWVSETNLQGNS
jgi:hypothetical protein